MRISDWSSDVCSSDLRVAPPGGADLEKGDPGDLARTQQFAGADRLVGAFGRRADPARTGATHRVDLRHHRGTRAPPGRLHQRLCAFRQTADAATGAVAVVVVYRTPAPSRPIRGARRTAAHTAARRCRATGAGTAESDQERPRVGRTAERGIGKEVCSTVKYR